MEDSCLYINNKREGLQLTWGEDGVPLFRGQWHNNLPLDTAIWWDKDGKVTAYRIWEMAFSRPCLMTENR